MDLTIATDDALWMQFTIGNEAALGELVKRYHDRVLRFLSKRINDVCTTEDIAQRVWQHFIEGRTTIVVKPGCFQAFLFGVANRYMLNARKSFARYRRRVRPEQDAVQEEWVPDTNTDAHPDPSQVAEHNELVAKLRSVVTTLQPDSREILGLSINEGLSMKEIADRLNISVSLAHYRFGKARERLAANFEADRRSENSTTLF